MAYSVFVDRRLSSILVLLIVVISFVVACPALPGSARGQEDVTVSITGSFYRQNPVIPQGSSVSGPSIYVIVTNAGQNDVEIGMVYEAPEGVTIGYDRGTFVLTPQQQQKVQITVNVADTVPAGDYPNSLLVSADVYRTGTGGAKTSASGAQRTSLTVSGTSANVIVSTLAPSGQPVVSQIRLFRMVGDTGYEVAFSNTGTLQAKVVPGAFTAEAYSVKPGGGKLCDPETFDVMADETKTVTLRVRMIYFEDDFVVSPNYDSETKKLLSALIMATLTNVYDTIANTEVKLVVAFNRDPLEEITVLGPLPLPLSQTGVPWNYIPSEGWRNGLYGFKYHLYVDGALTAETTEQTLKVGGGGISSWVWIIFVILGILAAAGLGLLIFFLLKRRKKREEEKPRKAEKKRKEERPAPKAKEPVPRPEVTRPPEPIRPPPLPQEEPIVEPSPLASVSSLKARMASLGRDQGTGQPDEEGEPEAGEQESPEERSSQDSAVDAVPPPPKVEPERPAVTAPQKPPASAKTTGQKPGIYSSVTATPKQEPPKPPSDVQINWPPKPVEPPKTSGLAEAARQRKEAQPPPTPLEEAVVDEPAEPETPSSRSSFAEAARLRMEARQRGTGGGAGTGEPPAEGDGGGEPGEGE